jgi:hypothetical protein
MLRTKETNIIKCYAQLFHGPFDNADFVVTVVYPNFHNESAPRTKLEYSHGQIIPKDLVKENAKHDEFFYTFSRKGKGEENMK